MTRRLRVWHVITGLNTGGAEVMLYRLLGRRDAAGSDVEVVSLTDVGPIGEKIRALGVPVRALGLARAAPNPVRAARLVYWLARERPDAVQTWMHDSDLVGGLAAFAARVPVAWGIHQGEYELRDAGQRRTRRVASVLARLSRFVPARIVCCSETSRRVHAGIGYDARKLVVIPNGFDVGAFRPDPAARPAVRAELGIPDGAPIVGHVGRAHPQKDHATFFAAAALLGARRPDVHFVLCGDGVSENAPLARGVDPAVRARVHLLGRRDDIPRLTAAFDLLASSSSFGEAFPLVIGEAMACGVPCVVTDAGDSALMVGATGRVVPRRDPRALADAWADVLALPGEERARLGRAARARVEEHYTLERCVGRYEALYREMAGFSA